jgi:hypothetical protein
MATAISLAGGQARQARFFRLHIVGLALGAVTMAFALTLVGAGLDEVLRSAGPPWAQAVLIGLALVAVGWTLTVVTGRGLPYPRPSWQVPEGWRHTLPTEFTLTAYGYLLGLGVLTNAVLPSLWVLIGLTVAVNSLPLATAAWLLYAASRAWTTRRDLSPHAPTEVSDTSLPHRFHREARAHTICRAATATLLVALTAASILTAATVG